MAHAGLDLIVMAQIFANGLSPLQGTPRSPVSPCCRPRGRSPAGGWSRPNPGNRCCPAPQTPACRTARRGTRWTWCRFLAGFHHQHRRRQRRDEPVALQKAHRPRRGLAGCVLAEDAAFARWYAAEPHWRRGRCVRWAPQGCRWWGSRFHRRPVPGAVQPVGQTADDEGSAVWPAPRRYRLPFRP